MVRNLHSLECNDTSRLKEEADHNMYKVNKGKILII